MMLQEWAMRPIGAGLDSSFWHHLLDVVLKYGSTDLGGEKVNEVV